MMGKMLAGFLGLAVIVLSSAIATAQVTCSSSKALCENPCWEKMGLAQLDCRRPCQEQYASCLKTGVFRTRALNHTRLQKK